MRKAVLITVVVLAVAGLPTPAEEPSETVAGEIVVPAGSHIVFALNTFISTKYSKTGDMFHGQVTFPVAVNNRIIIPAGSYVRGTIMEVKRAGRVKGKANLVLRFESVMLPNGVTKELNADLSGLSAPSGTAILKPGTEKVEGEASKGEDAGTIAGAGTTGAGIGAIGGIPDNVGKGVAIGAGAGALAGLATVLLTRGKDIELDPSTEFDLVLKRPLIFLEKELDLSNAPPSFQRHTTSAPRGEQRRNRGFWPPFIRPFPF